MILKDKMSKVYPQEIKQKVRKLITEGQSKTAVSKQMNIRLGTIIDWTRDMKRSKTYPPEIKQEVRRRVANGESKIDVSRKSGICYDCVLEWAKDIKTSNSHPSETKQKVRERVLNGETKKAVSKSTDICYDCVREWTKDIPTHTGYPQETKEEVRKRVASGESRIAIAESIGLSYDSVREWTRDIAVNRGKDTPLLIIRGRTLTVVKDLMEKGYSLEKVPKYTKITLKKHFPVNTARIRRNTIFYLEGRNEDAFKAFLDNFEVRAFTHNQIKSMGKAFGVKNA